MVMMWLTEDDTEVMMWYFRMVMMRWAVWWLIVGMMFLLWVHDAVVNGVEVEKEGPGWGLAVVVLMMLVTAGREV